MQRITFLLFLIISCFLSISMSAQDDNALKKERAIELMKLAQQEYIKIKDYEAVIVSTDIIDGKTRKTENILARYMFPSNIYLKWLPGPFEGMQASYLPSRDNANTFMAKETGVKGLLGTRKWSNDDALVKFLYPHNFTIQQTSFAYFFETMQYIVKKGTELNKLTVVSIEESIDKFTNQPVTSVLVELSSNPKDGLKWSKVHLFFDNKQKLPFHFILYDFSGAKSGEYAFTRFRMNIGLTSKDFEIK